MIHCRNLFSVLCASLTWPAVSWGQQFSMRTLNVVSDVGPVTTSESVQSEDGFIWMATSAGLCRYDGSHAHWVSLPIDTGISKLSLFADTLYIGFEDGHCCTYACGSGKAGAPIKTGSNSITAFVRRGRQLAIGMYGGGIGLWDGKTVKTIDTASGLPDNFIYDIAGVENILIAASDAGVTLLDLSGAIVRHLSNREGLSDNLASCLLKLDERNVLVGYDNGKADVLDLASFQVRPIGAAGPVLSGRITAACLLDRQVWLAASGAGLAILTQPSLERMDTYEPVSQVPGSAISSLMADQEGHILLHNGSHDLVCLDSRLLTVSLHEGIDFSGASAITIDRNGAVWFATDRGIFCHNETFAASERIRTFPKTAALPSQCVSLCEDADGNIWIGTFGHGVARLSPDDGSLRWFTERDGLINDNVLGITLVGRALWFSTLGGVSLLEDCAGNSFQRYGRDEGLGSSYIYCAIPAGSDSLLFGTDGAGIIVYAGGRFSRLNEKIAGVPRSVVSMATDHQGRTWMLNSSGALSVLSEGKVQAKRLTHDGQELEVFAMSACAQGSIGLLTPLGIGTLSSPASSLLLADGGRPVHTDFLNVLQADAQCNYWAATAEGMIRYSAGQSGFRKTPKSYIAEVQLFLEAIDTVLRRSFSHRENHIAFLVGSIWLSAPGEVTYTYILDGFHTEWMTTRDVRIAFPQLKPGSYTFRVRAQSGSLMGDIRQFSFTIRAAYWTQWWFLLAAASSLGLLAAYAVRMRIRALRKRDRAARERLQSQLDTLRNQVNPHFLFNSFNTLTAVIEKDPDQAVDYVAKLSDFFRTILQQQGKEVISVADELALLDTYFYLQRQRFGDNLRIGVDVPATYHSAAIPPLTLQMLAENAVKHNVISRDRPLTIAVTGKDGHLVFCNNLQERSVREKSTGIGLQNIINRYRILFGKEVTVEKSTTHFTVTLPLLPINGAA